MISNKAKSLQHIGGQSMLTRIYETVSSITNETSFVVGYKKETIIKRIEQRKTIENRSDDDLNTIVKRYDKYMETTKPVLDFYSKNSNFYELDGSTKIEEITAKINSFLNL